MARSMKAVYTFNRDNISPSPTNMSPHIVKQRSYIDDFWLTCRIFNYRTPLSLDCCQHRINRSTDTNGIHINTSSSQTLTTR